jgi:hypothetical protein
MTIVNDLDAVAMRLPATSAVECNTITQAARRLTVLADRIRGAANCQPTAGAAFDVLHDIANQIAGP